MVCCIQLQIKTTHYFFLARCEHAARLSKYRYFNNFSIPRIQKDTNFHFSKRYRSSNVQIYPQFFFLLTQLICIFCMLIDRLSIIVMVQWLHVGWDFIVSYNLKKQSRYFQPKKSKLSKIKQKMSIIVMYPHCVNRKINKINVSVSRHFFPPPRGIERGIKYRLYTRTVLKFEILVF